MVAHNAVLRTSLQKACDDAIIAFAGYFLLAAATIHFTSDGRNHATMWPADALVLALLLRNAKVNWPLILAAGWAANLLANTVTRGWIPGLVVYGGINMMQACAAAWLICKGTRRDNLLADAPTVVRFVLCAGMLGPLMGATLGSLATAINYGEAFWPSFMRWYVSNALGQLLLTPFLMALFDGGYLRCFKERTGARRMKALALHTFHALITVGVFSQNLLPLLFLPILSILVLSYRLGRLGTVMGSTVLGLVGLVATYYGQGPMSLTHLDSGTSELFFQFYLACVLATTLPVATTVSAKAEALAHLAERDAALRLMMAHSPDGILSFDAEGVCRWADGPLGAYLGVEPGSVLGKPLSVTALHSPVLAERVASCGHADEAIPSVFEFTPLLRPQLTVEASMRVLQIDGSRVGTVVTLHDVTQRKAKETAMLTRAQSDDLTGLANRSGFRKQLRAFLADNGRPTTLALVDVDAFTSINDHYGQAVGDAVLVEIGRRMKAATRQEDVVARLGGDEFAILLRCDIDTAHKICERMLDSIRETPVFGNDSVSILASVSCGMAQYQPGMSHDQIFDIADAALYEVKRSGRNSIRVAA